MTITTQPPRLHLTSSADYAKLELALPASAVDPETNAIDAAELLRQIALALDHDDGTPAEVVATILAWSHHLLQLEKDDRWQAFLEWEQFIIEERGGPITEDELAEARAWLRRVPGDEDEAATGTEDQRAADVG